MKNDYFFRSPFFLLTLYKLMCVKATVGYLQIPFLTFFSHFLRAQTNVHYLRLGVLSHTKSFFFKDNRNRYLPVSSKDHRCCILIGRLTWTQIRGLGECFLHFISLLTCWEWSCKTSGCGMPTSSPCRPRRGRRRSTDTSRTSPGGSGIIIITVLNKTSMTIEAHQWLVPAVVLQLAALQQLGPAQQRREGTRLQHGEPAAANLVVLVANCKWHEYLCMPPSPGYTRTGWPDCDTERRWQSGPFAGHPSFWSPAYRWIVHTRDFLVIV